MVSDELYAPLGLPLPEPAAPRFRLRKAHLAALAPAALAVAFSASSLDRHAPPPLFKPTQVAAVNLAPAPGAPPPAAEPSEGERPDASRPLKAPGEAAGVKVISGSPELPPGGIFINVREALSAQGHPGESRAAPSLPAR